VDENKRRVNEAPYVICVYPCSSVVSIFLLFALLCIPQVSVVKRFFPSDGILCAARRVLVVDIRRRTMNRWKPAAPSLVLVVGVVFAAGVLAGILRGESETMNVTSKTGRPVPEETEAAVFGAGCFWGVEAAFRKTDGVVETFVGYSGGHTKAPTYKDVCAGTTDHAEAVKVVFDPEKVPYGDLLKVFFSIHDPTQVNRQGPDVGYQYRSVVFYDSPEQETAARAAIANLDESKAYVRPIATAVEPLGDFWLAEDYHQQYLEKHGSAGCHISLK
jgi:peptide-methionine (S)-S-oxide reductase